MTDLDYSNLNDKLAIVLLYILTTSLITLGLLVIILSILDSRSMQPRYRTDAWFMKLAIVPYDFLKYLITKIKNHL